MSDYVDCDKSILVSGIPDDLLNEESMEIAFENDGKVEKIEIDKKKGTAVVTFESEKDSQKLIQAGVVKSNVLEYKLTIKKYVIVPQREVLISMSKPVPQMRLKLFLSSKKGIDAKVEEIRLREDKNDAVVTFKDPEDASKVVKQKTLTMKDGTCLTAEWYVPSPEETILQRSLVIKGLPSEIDQQSIEYILDDVKEADGAKIQRISIDKDNKRAVVVFEDVQVAEQLKSLGSIEQGDLSLSLSACDLDLQVPEEETLDKPKSDGVSVIVKGLAGDLDKERLDMFFSNKRRGGPIENLDLQLSSKKAIIKFQRADDAKRVVETASFKLDNMELLTEWYIPVPTDDTLILVQGTTEFSEDYLVDLFENENKTGGGDVERVQKLEGSAVIKFKDSAVAKRVAAKREVSTKNAILYVSMYSEESSTMCTVELSGLNKDITAERIYLFMENKRHSVGGPVDNIEIDEAKACAYVTFKNPEDAQKVASCGQVRISSVQLQAKLCFHEVQFSAPKANEKEVKVEGLNGKIDEDTLEVLFENKQKSGGGPIESINIAPDKNSAMIVFEKTEDANEVLKRGKVQFENYILTCKRLYVKSETRDSNSDNQPFELTNLKQNTSKDLIELFFQSKAKSGGGDIEKLTYNASEGRAILQFKNPQDADDVWRKVQTEGLVLNGSKLCVQRLDSEKLGTSAFCVNSCAIEVKDLPAHEDNADLEEAIHTLFENANMSGGGKIEGIYIQHDGQRAVITFKKPETVESVMEKYHKSGVPLDKIELKIRPLPIGGGLPVPDEELEPTKLFLGNLSEDLDKDELEELITTLANVAISETIYGLEIGKALLIFKASPNFENIFQYLRMKPMNGSMVAFQKVPKSRQIEVYCITKPKKLTDMQLQLYFESQKSNGGDVENIDRREQHDCAIVTFNYHKDAVKVLRQGQHVIQKQSLIVKEHNLCIGILPPTHDRTEPVSSIPSGCTIEVDRPEIINFIISVPKQRQTLQEVYSKKFAEVIIPKFEENIRMIEIKCKLTKQVVGYQALARTWCKEVKDIFEEFTKQYDHQIVEVPSITAESITKFIHESEKSKPTQVKVVYNAEQSNAAVIGCTADVEKSKDKLCQKIAQTKLAIERKMNIKQDSLKMNSIKASLLIIDNWASKIEKSFEDMTVRIEPEIGHIVITGAEEDLVKVKLQAFEYTSNVKSKEVKLNLELMPLFRNETVKQYADKKLKENNVQAVFEANGETLVVHSFNGRENERASNIIEKCVSKQQIKLDENAAQTLRTKQWSNTKEELITKFRQCVILHESDNNVVILAIEDIISSVYDALTEFFKTNTIVERYVTAPQGNVKVISAHDRSLKDIKESYVDYSVMITPVFDSNQPGFKLKGSVEGLEEAAKEVKTLLESILSEKHKVDKPGMATYFQEEAGKQMLKSIESSCKVGIEIASDEEDFDLSSYDILDSRTASVIAKPQEMARIDIGITVIVQKVDLTTFRSDCIVLPATVYLKPCEGIGKKLSAKAGSAVQKECEAYAQRQGRLLTGDLYPSQGGQLLCNRILHTVFPEWTGGRRDEETELFEGFTKAMKTAAKFNAQKLAIPGSVLDKYPRDISTSVLANALREYAKKFAQNTLKEVYIIIDDAGVEMAVQQLCSNLQPPAFGAFSGSKVSTGTGFSGTKGLFQATSDAKTLMTLEGIKVSLVIGAMAQQKVDAIVNTTSHELKLTQGAVSKTLLQAGGNILQQECDVIVKKGFSPGDVAQTTGGNLKCKKVFHGCCESYSIPGAVQVFEKFVRSCLVAAHTNGMTSIAVPALGTGNLGFPKDFVACKLYEHVALFSKTNPTTPLRDIKFILYDKDLPTIQAFEKQIQILVAEALTVSVKPKNPPKPPVKPTKKRGARKLYVEEPTIPGGSTSMKESQKGKPVQIKIGQISLQVKQGDLTKEKTDVIVNSTNESMSFSSQVSKAILKGGGDEIEKECRKIGRMRDNIAITGSGKLKCKKIIHMNAAGHDAAIWKTRIMQCLDLLEKQKLKSISFPAVGTGQVGNSAATMAEIIMDAIAEFSNTNPQHVQLIKMVIFDEKMVDEFESHLHKIAQSNAGKKKGFSLLGYVKGVFGYSSDSAPAKKSAYDQPNDFLKSTDNVKRGQTHEVMYENKSLYLTIYGFDQSSIRQAIQSVDKICNDESTERVVDGTENSEKIGKLSLAEIQSIKKLQMGHPVLIVVDKGARLNRILIQGRSKEIADVYIKIKEILFQAEKAEIHEKLQKDLQTKVQWQYAEGDGYIDYPPDINYLIEDAYNAHKSDVLFTEQSDDSSQEQYVINLHKLIEHPVGNTAKSTAVRRYAPDTIELPKTWTTMAASEQFKVVDIVKGDTDFEEVETKFIQGVTENNGVTSGKYTAVAEVEIKTIQRIQNSRIYKNCQTRRKHMQMTITPGQVFERELWHGTSADTLEEVNVNGFNRSFCGKNATAYGDGVYFAVNANYSHRYAKAAPDGTRSMYLCRVLTGEYTKGTSGLKVPPPKNLSSPTIKYDSVVDNLADPNMFVVFYDDQAYPEYLVTYIAK